MENGVLLKAGRLADLGVALAPGVHRLPAGESRAILSAEDLVAAAEAKAAEITAAAERAYRAEKERGFAEGLAEGKATVIREIMAEQAALDRNLAELEGNLARLALSVARQLIGEAAEAEVALALTRRALLKMRREKRAELRVTPEVSATLRERLPALLEEFPEVELVDVVEDTTLNRGSIILESKIGRVDADVEALLAAFEGTLVRAVRERAAGALGEADTETAAAQPSEGGSA